MRFRRSRDSERRLAQQIAAGDGQELRPSTGALWSDGFGRFATRALQVIIVITLSAGIIWGLRVLSTLFIPIVLALIFASTFWPLTRRLKAQRVPGALIAVVELLGIIGLLTLIGWAIVWAVQDQWDELASSAMDGFNQLIEWSQTLPFAPSIEQLEEWQTHIFDFISTADLGSGALAGVSAVATFFTGLILMIVVLFFFLKDGPLIWRFILRPFHGEALARAERVGKRTVETLGSYVRGTATVALVDAIGIGLGLVILQVPLALPLAVLVFLLSFIPLIGAVIAGVLGALVALVANGPVSAVLVVIIVVAVNQLEGNLLQPVLMGKMLKLHALVILLALAAGTVIAGILGAVLAVPIAAVVWGVLQVWDGPNLPAKWFRVKPGDPR